MTIAPENKDLAASLGRGETLPASWYTDPAVFELEKELIFNRSWQYVGLAGQIPEPGDYITSRAGHVPIVVVRDEDGAVNAFVNVCRHRGSELVRDECGHRKTLQCPYHAWTYGLDGALLAAPRANRNPGFDPSGISLFELQTHVVGPLIFANPDPEAPPFSEVLGEWETFITQEADIDLDAVLKLREVRTIDVAANWKVQCQNNMECYHCPINHPTLAAAFPVNHDMWYDEHAYFVRYGLPPTAKSQDELSAVSGFYRIEAGDRQEVIVHYIWPNFFLGIQAGSGSASLGRALPVAAGRTLYVRHYCFADNYEEKDQRDIAAFLDQTFAEDKVIVESVQRGLSSPPYERGQIMLPVTDEGVRFQERLVYRALSGD